MNLGPCSNAQQPITFEFRPKDGSALFQRVATLAADCSFTLSDIPARSYNVWVKGAKWLASVVPVDVTSGDATGFVAALHGGDANNDNHVDIMDLGLLADFYNTDAGDGYYDSRADFNCDGHVDILDLGILADNYNMDGAP